MEWVEDGSEDWVGVDCAVGGQHGGELGGRDEGVGRGPCLSSARWFLGWVPRVVGALAGVCRWLYTSSPAVLA